MDMQSLPSHKSNVPKKVHHLQDSQAQFEAECYYKIKIWHFDWGNREEGEINVEVRVRKKK